MFFDYFYGAQADLFSFYRIPKNLFTDARFSGLSSDAKVLYGLMLDRMGLSARNGWQDELGRVYIVFSIGEVMDAMNVSKKTACKYMAELDTQKGIGLIERVRLGLGQKDRIYVRNFVTGEAGIQPVISKDEQEREAYEDEPAEKENKPEQEQESKINVSPTESQIYTSRGVKSTPQQNTLGNCDFQRCKNYTSRSVKSTLLEEQKVHPINNTKYSDTDISHINHSADVRAMDAARMYKAVRTSVETQIEADTLKEEHGEVIDEIVELITDVMITPAATLRVSGADRPVTVLRTQFARLTAAHVEAALWNLGNRASEEITDMKAYMRTLLYNELFSMDMRIKSEVRKR